MRFKPRGQKQFILAASEHFRLKKFAQLQLQLWVLGTFDPLDKFKVVIIVVYRYYQAAV